MAIVLRFEHSFAWVLIFYSNPLCHTVQDILPTNHIKTPDQSIGQNATSTNCMTQKLGNCQKLHLCLQ